jgi:hypothetical protein
MRKVMSVIDWSRVLPVVISIVILIAVAILRNYSRELAAIAATMPINIPLGMWIVYAGGTDSQKALSDFTASAALNILPTVLFLIVAWQLTKAGLPLIPTLVAGYIAWALSLGLLYLVRSVLGA